MKWLRNVFGTKPVVEYQLSEVDRQIIEASQFQQAALFDEMQSFVMEMNATRVVLECIHENLMEIYGGLEKGKGRGHRPPHSKDNQGQGKG